MVTAWVGLLWALPVPEMFSQASTVFNWGTLFMMAALVYYFILSLPLAFGLLPFILLVVLLTAWLSGSAVPLAPLSVVALLAGLMIHSALQNDGARGLGRTLLFLMLGPPWLLARVYRQFNIRY